MEATMDSMREHVSTRRDTGGSTLQRLLNRGDINVGSSERVLSLVGGGLITLLGLSRGTLGGLLLTAVGGTLLYRGASGHCPIYQRLDFDTSHRGRSPSTSVPSGHGVRVERTITINRPAETLYRFWRNFENLPKIMSHLESVTVQSDKRSHWVTRGPMDMKIEWDAEIIHEEENHLIGWRSVGKSQVDHAGSVHFKPAPGGRGTEIKVVLRYDPPGGKAGAAFAKLFRNDPSRQIEEDLRHFKQVMEAGEIPVAGEVSVQTM